LAGMIQFRFNADYVQRFDALATRLGFNRTQVIRNLLSADPILIDMIEHKAKTLMQVTIQDVLTNRVDSPSVVTIRLDRDYEQRFNDLATSLGINRVQVLRNLLSGDEVLISGLCKKAKAIKIRPLKASEVEHDPIPQQLVNNVPVEHLNVFQEISEQQVGTNVLPEFNLNNEQSSKSKRGRKKNNVSNVDHSEARRLIVEHLNQLTLKNFGADTKESIDAIDKMLNEGKEPSEFIRIIDNMVSVWLDNPKMNVRLCPETLFRPMHWEKYLNANPSTKVKIKQKGSTKTSNKYDKFYL